MFRSQTYHRGSHLLVMLLLRLLVSLLLFIAFSYPQPSFALNTTEEYLNCNRVTTFSCGDDLETKIKYPFWTNDQPDYCGHPGYNLTCNGDDKTLSIEIGGKTYRVRKSIDYEKQVLDLIDADLFAAVTSNSCPEEISNTTGLESSSLTYLNNDINLTFFLHCNSIFSLPGINLLPITYCSNDFFGQTSFFALHREAITLDVNAFCASIVSVAVYDHQFSPDDFITGGKTFFDALKVGFGLTWTVGQSWCGKCTKDGGLCGNNVSHPSEPACFCPPGTTNTGTSCTRSTNGDSAGSVKTKKKTSIIIGSVLGGVAGIFMICCLWWLCSLRKRQQRSSSTLLGRASPSDPSSMKDPEYGSTHYPTHIFCYQELEEATGNFAEANELGDGGFGTVYKGILRDGRTVAVKRLYENNYKRVEQFANEILILSRLRHTNLVILYGCTSRHSRELLLVYEFVPNGTVADHLHGPRAHEGSLTWPVRMSIAIETADALAYLHAVKPQIIHRDVKTNNILLDNNFHVKVADFGLSRLFPAHVTHVSTAPQGTPGYVDPEYHQCYQLTEKSDVYSFGVVLVELISSKPAVDITRHRHEINLANMAINKIQNSELDELIDPALGYETDYGVKRMITLVAELAFRCLQGDGDLRPPIREVLEVLREIERGGSKAAEDDIPMKDDAGLLKSLPPDSPDTVMDKWSSKVTTPNTSK